MHIRYDAKVDALSVRFRETTLTTRELANGIVAEYDADDRLVGLEILDASQLLDGPASVQSVTLEGIGLFAPSATSTPTPSSTG
jgi:uncharacterized protein YuzE